MNLRRDRIAACLMIGFGLPAVLNFGCNRDPSAEELAKRIETESPTYEEDRVALVAYGQDAIAPCIDRALSEPSEPLHRSVMVGVMLGDILNDIDPAATMAEIEKRYETGDFKTRQRLMQLAIGIGEPHTEPFAKRQLKSLALENVAFAILLLEPYKKDPGVVATLKQSMESDDRMVRVCAAMVAVKDSVKAISVLEEAIADEGLPLNLRLQLVFSIGDGPIVEAKAALRRLRYVKNEDVRNLVHEALERFRRPISMN